MLNFIRRFRENTVGRWIFAGLAFLLVASFAVWGIGDMFLAPKYDRTIAKVGSVEIKADDFLRAYQDETEELAELLGEEFDEVRGRELGFVASVMNTLVGRALFDNVSEKLGLDVGRDSMRTRITEIPQFQDEFGTFNELIFRRVLSESGFSEESFLRNLKRDLKRTQLIDTVIALPEIPPSIVLELAKIRKEQRTADSILVAIEEMEAPPPPDNAKLQEWFLERTEKYNLPALRSFSYFHIHPSQLVDEIVIAKEDVEDLYEQRKSTYDIPEKRRILQMRLESEQTAQQAFEAITKGEEFSKVAERLASLKAEDIDLGLITKQDLLEGLSEPVFQLKLKELGGPYQTAFGWHIMRVEEIQEGKTSTFEEKQGELTDELALNEALDAVYSLMIRVEDELAGGATLAQAADSVGAKVQTIQKASSGGNSYEKNPEGEKITAIPQRVFDETFVLANTGDISGVIDSGEDGFFVQRLEQTDQARPKTFEEALGEVERDWQQQAKKQRAKDIAAEITLLITQGKSLKQVAASSNLKVVSYKPFSRLSFGDQEIPPPFAEKLFQAKKGELVSSEITEGFVIGKVTSIEAADTSKGLEPIVDAFTTNTGGDLVMQYQSKLRQKYRIVVDEGAIDEVL